MMQDYATDFWRGMDDLHGFSFYRKPIQNIEPCRAITVVDVYRYLVRSLCQAADRHTPLFDITFGS